MCWGRTENELFEWGQKFNFESQSVKAKTPHTRYKVANILSLSFITCRALDDGVGMWEEGFCTCFIASNSMDKRVQVMKILLGVVGVMKLRELRLKLRNSNWSFCCLSSSDIYFLIFLWYVMINESSVSRISVLLPQSHVALILVCDLSSKEVSPFYLLSIVFLMQFLSSSLPLFVDRWISVMFHVLYLNEAHLSDITSRFLLFNFLPSAVLTWRPCERLRWVRH